MMVVMGALMVVEQAMVNTPPEPWVGVSIAAGVMIAR